MNTAFFRTLIIFAVCVVLAIWLGLSLAGQLTYSSLLIYGVLGFILVFPLLLRWHYPLMLLGWNLAVVVLFMPGRPQLCLPLIAVSLFISVLQRMMSRESQFINVPQIILPLFFMFAVIVVTARMTGFGLHVFGAEVYGGKKYFYLLIGILGYFALSAHRTPPERINLYLGLFFLGGVTNVIGDLIPLLPHPAYYLYYVFQPTAASASFQNAGPNAEATRLDGTRLMCLAIFWYMMARYGIRGMFLSRKPWRWVIFSCFFVLGLFGGFRGYVISCGLLFAIQFLLEGLHKTRLMPIFTVAGILGALALMPLAEHLPYTFQRALTFLPYKVSNAARMDAQASWDWRVNMWEGLLPQIPQYLLLGKGYTISPQDYDFVMGPEASVHSNFAENDPMSLAENFHSGPISTVIPFGIWGCLALLWFLAVGTWALYRNYRYGDPALKTVNTFLLAAFVGEAIFFIFGFGDLSTDMMKFTGMLGLSVSFNGGVRRPVRAVQPARDWDRPRRLPSPPAPVPAFQRRQPGTIR
ncbi:MAG: hypothetical protein ACLPRE_03155 [Limisphaerales bacterium]